MIEVEEPKRTKFTIEEEKILKDKFVRFIHFLLLIYLFVHYVILPFVINIQRDDNFLANIDLWFLAHLFFHLVLIRKKDLTNFAFILVSSGCLFRLLWEGTDYRNYSSWILFSFLVTQISSVVFIFIYSSIVPNIKMSKSKWVLAIMIGAISSFVLFELKVKPQEKIVIDNLKEVVDYQNLKDLGCLGSEIVLKYPIADLQYREAQKNIRILDCGFERSRLFINRSLTIQSSLPLVNVRVYRLKKNNSRMSWQFVRLVQLAKNKSVDISPYLDKGDLFLLRVPERKGLGHVVLIPKDADTSMFGQNGNLQISYNFLRWTNEQ